MKYYFDEFATEDIQMWVRECGKSIPRAKLRGDLDDQVRKNYSNDTEMKNE